jgi:hypothetical protein
MNLSGILCKVGVCIKTSTWLYRCTTQGYLLLKTIIYTNQTLCAISRNNAVVSSSVLAQAFSLQVLNSPCRVWCEAGGVLSKVLRILKEIIMLFVSAELHKEN